MGNIYFIVNDKSTHFIIEKMMQHSNLQGVGFQNGTDLLEKYHQEKPDMILLNTKLPGMSGLEILKEIRKRIVFLLDVGLEYLTLNRYRKYPYSSSLLYLILKHDCKIWSMGIDP